MLRPLATVLILSATAAAVVTVRTQFPEPTAQHVEILESAGTWEGTMTSYLPGMPSEPFEATEVVEAFGPFFVQAEFACEFMGMPYIGTGYVGYDETKGKYVGTWIDNTTSYLAVMEGEMNAEKNALVMHWDAPDQMNGGEMTKHWSETVRSEDEYTSTFYMGDNVKTMTIHMKRVNKKTIEARSER